MVCEQRSQVPFLFPLQWPVTSPPEPLQDRTTRMVVPSASMPWWAKAPGSGNVLHNQTVIIFRKRTEVDFIPENEDQPTCHSCAYSPFIFVEGRVIVTFSKVQGTIRRFQKLWLIGVQKLRKRSEGLQTQGSFYRATPWVSIHIQLKHKGCGGRRLGWTPRFIVFSLCRSYSVFLSLFSSSAKYRSYEYLNGMATLIIRCSLVDEDCSGASILQTVQFLLQAQRCRTAAQCHRHRRTRRDQNSLL